MLGCVHKVSGTLVCVWSWSPDRMVPRQCRCRAMFCVQWQKEGGVFVCWEGGGPDLVKEGLNCGFGLRGWVGTPKAYV